MPSGPDNGRDSRRPNVRQPYGQMLTKQVVLIQGQRITEVGPDGTVTIPAELE